MRILEGLRRAPTVEYRPFAPHRKVAEYLGQPGDEPNGLILPWAVLDSYAASVSKRLPEEYAVIGEDLYSDGRRFLRFGSRREHIEATTDFRYDANTRQFRRRCEACGSWDGKHKRGCEG